MARWGRQIKPDQRPRHAIVQDLGARERNKLKSAIVFGSDPPPGYTFIAAGDPDLTRELKEIARRDGKKILSVTTTPHKSVHELSQEVHRIGFHFPTEVVQELCDTLGIHITRHGTLADSRYAEILTRRHEQTENPDDDLDQTTINTMARDSIQDLFPNIPEQDLYQIIKTAFQKGQRKVGTANELSQIRRAQLSVVAHIRHVYTDYDRLLRTVGYRPARHRVEKDTLKKLVEWRGDDETGKNSLEQVIEDVIVLSDDDDEDTANDITFSVQAQRSARSPIITTQIIDPQDIDNSGLEDDQAGRRHYLPQPATRRRLIDDHFADEALHRQRQARWEKARDEHRQNPVSLKPIIVLDHSLRSMDLRQPLEFHDYSVRRRGEQFSNHAAHERVRHESRISPPRGRGSSALVRGEDGYLYERIVHHQKGKMPPPSTQLNTSHRLHSRQDLDQLNHRNQYGSRPYRTRGESPRLRDGDDTVVPSIEGPPLSPWSVQRSDPRHQPLSISTMERNRSSLHRNQQEIIDQTQTSLRTTARKRKIDDLGTNGMGDLSMDTDVLAPHSFRSSGQYEYDTERPMHGPLRVLERPLLDQPALYRPSSPVRDVPPVASFTRSAVDDAPNYLASDRSVPSGSLVAPRKSLVSLDDAQVQYRVPTDRVLRDASHTNIAAATHMRSEQRASQLVERSSEAPRYHSGEPLRRREIIELRSDNDALRRPPRQVVARPSTLDRPREKYLDSPRRYALDEQHGPIRAPRAQFEDRLYDENGAEMVGSSVRREYRDALPLVERRYENIAND